MTQDTPPLFQPLSTAFGYISAKAGRWGRESTLVDHFTRHGSDFGATSADDYSRMATELVDIARAKGLPTKTGPDGTIRIYDPSTNPFGAYNP